MLERLRAAGITINLPKSTFFPTRRIWVNDGRVIADPKKIEVIRRIKTPTNISEVRSLLGVLGCYQSFIAQFAEVLREQKNIFSQFFKQ